MLATSREGLAVDGEVLRPLRSLVVPGESATVVEAAGVPAVQLFADRARALRPEFALDDTTTPVVAGDLLLAIEEELRRRRVSAR